MRCLRQPGAGSTDPSHRLGPGFGAGSFRGLSGDREGAEGGGSRITKGGACGSKDVSPRGAAEAGGGCENDLSEQTIAGPRRSHFKGIDH